MSNPKPTASWKEGQSGNPNGRPPKGYSITEWFHNMFNESPEVKDAMGKSIIKKALEGDVSAQKMIWQYMDGMPLQKNEIGGIDGEPIKYLFEIVQDNKLLDANAEDTDTNQELLSSESDIPQS